MLMLLDKVLIKRRRKKNALLSKVVVNGDLLGKCRMSSHEMALSLYHMRRMGRREGRLRGTV
jgi:hypothetical protein